MNCGKGMCINKQNSLTSSPPDVVVLDWVLSKHDNRPSSFTCAWQHNAAAQA